VSLESKKILITGASSGIGQAIATHLHQKGFHVIGTSRTPEKYNLPYPLLPLDLNSDDSIRSCVDRYFENYETIDVLINNAGVGITGPLEELSKSEVLKNFQINFFGPMQLMQFFLPKMRANQSGLIINITSIAGYVGLPFRSIYSSSKAALEILTEGLRMELKPYKIDVVNLAPGDFATNIADNRYHEPLHEDSAYYSAYKNCLETMNTHVADGNNPQDIGLAVEKILRTKKPKIHYKVGSFMQTFAIVLKRVLPDLWFEKLLINNQKT
jgi:short-subunit dehydrogenase